MLNFTNYFWNKKNIANGTSCANRFTGYCLEQLISFEQCGSELCGSCMKN